MKNGLVVVIALSTLLIGGTLFSQDPAVDESVAPSPLVVTEDRDPGAESFLIKCSGCHSVGHGMRTGPDLLPSTSWPEATLRPGILRMEEKTGPLPPEEVDAILSLMKDPTLAARLARQEERIAQRFAATLDAPNLREGRELFHGAKALAKEECLAARVTPRLGVGEPSPPISPLFGVNWDRLVSFPRARDRTSP